MCPSGLEEREMGNFGNLTRLSTPYMLVGGGSTIRCEEMDWGWDKSDQSLHLLPSFNGAFSISGTIHSNGSGLQQDNGIPGEIE